MTLKEARRKAIELAKTLDEGIVTIWRIKPRVFAFAEGYGPENNDTVMMVHVSWAKEGYYERYHPEWVSA